MVSRYSLIIWLAILFSGCRPATPPPTSAPVSTVASTPVPDAPPTPTVPPDKVRELRNAKYQLGATDALQVVQLADGKFEQGTPASADFISVSVTDFVAVGDLNADGENEVAALVSENYGGTGVFVFLAVYSNVAGRLTFQTSTLVDDRPQLKALSIENNEIIVDVVIHSLDDPMCCPTVRTTRHYRWSSGNQLDMTDYTTFTGDGRPRTITIQSPTTGTEVYVSVPIKGSVAVAPFENNLVYHIYDVGGVELSAGAITVSAADLGAPGRFDTVIPLGHILSGAVIRIEVQDLSAADGSLLAMDSVELVVK